MLDDWSLLVYRVSHFKIKYFDILKTVGSKGLLNGEKLDSYMPKDNPGLRCQNSIPLCTYRMNIKTEFLKFYILFIIKYIFILEMVVEWFKDDVLRKYELMII